MIQEMINNFIDRVSGSAFDLISAGVIFLFGWYFAYEIGKKAGEVFCRAKLNQIVKRLGWEKPIIRVWRGGDLAKLFGKAVEIWILLFFLMVCAGILQLAEVSGFLNIVVMYFFNIFAAFFIFAMAAEAILRFGGENLTAKILKKLKND